MPIVAVAALAAGAAVATGVVAASTVALVGLGTTIVGKVTKSKELLQLGSGMSLGAGVASVAQSVFGASATAGTAAAGAAPIEAAGTGAAETGGVDALAGTPEAATAGIESAAQSGAPTGGLEGAGASTPAGGTGGLLGSTPQASQALGSAPQASAAPGTPNLLGSSVANAAAPAVAIAPPPATDSGSIASWFSRQPESVKNRILQVGGQAAGGLFEGWSAEQKVALERERLKLLQDQARNANAQPRVRFATPVPANGGLLNSAKG